MQNIFKTIRKYRGAAVSITQDIKDLFAMKNGEYGRSIVSNSEFKIAFSLEKQNINILEQHIELTEKEKTEIMNLERGTAWIMAKKERAIIKIEACEEEKKIIIGGG